MRAATTKILHSLCEKTYLKTPNEMYDFINKMYDLFTRMLYDGEGGENLAPKWIFSRYE